MKLYYSPGACSQAPHILLHELGLNHDSSRVDLRNKLLEDGSSYLDINPKGSVPALEMDSGDVLTENAVILQYLGDRSANDDALPGLGSFRRYRVLEWVNYITTEVHKSFSPLFNPAASEDTKALFRDTVAKKLAYIDGELGEGPFLCGDALSIADPYLFVMAGWADNMIGLDQLPNIRAFRARMMERPAVRQVLSFEGLLQEPATA